MIYYSADKAGITITITVIRREEGALDKSQYRLIIGTISGDTDFLGRVTSNKATNLTVGSQIATNCSYLVKWRHDKWHRVSFIMMLVILYRAALQMAANNDEYKVNSIG